MAASITFTPGSLGSINEGDSVSVSGRASLNSVWNVIVAKYPTADRDQSSFTFTAGPDSSSVANILDFSGAPINPTTSIAENTSTTDRIKVADITITDDGQGTNILSVSGTDDSSFEIVGTALYLKAGTTLDFETKPSYNVTVNVNDPTVGGNPDATRAFTLNVTDVNDAPTAVSFNNAVTLLSENVDTSGRIKLADIIVVDDGLGTNNFSLSGTDAASFEIIDTRLFLRAGTLLDFETKPVYNVTVNVDDPTLGSNPDARSTFTLNLEDAVDASPFLVINNNISGVGSLRWAIALSTSGTALSTLNSLIQQEKGQEKGRFT